MCGTLENGAPALWSARKEVLQRLPRLVTFKTPEDTQALGKQSSWHTKQIQVA